MHLSDDIACGKLLHVFLSGGLSGWEVECGQWTGALRGTQWCPFASCSQMYPGWQNELCPITWWLMSCRNLCLWRSLEVHISCSGINKRFLGSSESKCMYRLWGGGLAGKTLSQRGVAILQVQFCVWKGSLLCLRDHRFLLLPNIIHSDLADYDNNSFGLKATLGSQGSLWYSVFWISKDEDNELLKVEAVT